MLLRELTANISFTEASPEADLFLAMPGGLCFPLSRVTFSPTHHVIFEVYGSNRRMSKRQFLSALDMTFSVDGSFEVIVLFGALTFFVSDVRQQEEKLLLDWHCMLNKVLVTTKNTQKMKI